MVFIANANDRINSAYFASEVLLNEFISNIFKALNILVDLFLDKKIRPLTLSSTKVEINSAINLLNTLKLSFLLGAARSSGKLNKLWSP